MRSLSIVTRDQNRINITRMNHPKAVDEFLVCIRDGLQRGFQDFVLSFRGADSAYPNVCTPFAGIMAYYEDLGLRFEITDVPEVVNRSLFLHPFLVSDYKTQLAKYPLNVIWRFDNSDDVNTLVDAFIREISQTTVCGHGVLEGLTWCLSEVMDNVLQHSGVNVGYVMGQIHKSTKHIAFCVFDHGQGIFNSLRNSRYAPRYPLDAITLCIKEGVTRDPQIGQGNGMWGLHNIVKSNSGILVITSNSASYVLRRDEILTFTNLPTISKENGMTIIDFQIDFDKGISIAESLGGHIPVNLRLESFEDEKGNLVYRLAEKSSGTGTRQSGERIRNEVMNLYQETGRGIDLDFENISVISSSFADELIGKLVVSFGFFGFNQIFKIKNMNAIVQSIVNRSVAQRMMEAFAHDKTARG